jgi:large subunit ribosomal protein L6
VSRVGRLPITVPNSVRVGIDGQMVSVQGPKGTLALGVHPKIQVALDDRTLHVNRPDDAQQSKALHGMTRALLANMVTGVTDGFARRLIITGVGYRAEVQGSALVLFVGYSHTVRIEAPEGVSFEVDRTGRLIGVLGADKAMVGETAARVRAVRKPEPYHGTGIAYEGEVIRRKAGKAGRSGGKK